MPRAKPKRTPPYFQIYPFQLSMGLTGDLIELLGFDSAVSDEQTKINKAVTAIEHYVGRYMGIAAVEKELPSNASLIAELNAFVKAREFNQVTLGALHPWLQQRFQHRGLDLSSAEQDCAVVLNITNEIIESLSGEHRGKPVDRSFQDLLKQLRTIFRGFRQMDIDPDVLSKYLDSDDLPNNLDPLGDDDTSINEAYLANLEWRARLNEIIASGGQTKRLRQGSVENRSPVEADELEFVTLILRATGRRVPKNLPDLLNRVGRAPQDRADVLNQIAKRARRRQPSHE
jgi:hypothetical protein